MQNNGISIKQITGNKSKFGNLYSLIGIRYLISMMFRFYLKVSKGKKLSYQSKYS